MPEKDDNYLTKKRSKTEILLLPIHCDPTLSPSSELAGPTTYGENLIIKRNVCEVIFTYPANHNQFRRQWNKHDKHDTCLKIYLTGTLFQDATMVQNRKKKHRKNSHFIIHCPTSE